MTEKPTPRRAKTKNRETIHAEIDRNLRRAFDEVAQEPLPDRFSALLDRLRQDPADQDSAPQDAGSNTAKGDTHDNG